MKCGQVHSQARQFVAAGHPAHLVAETLEISRSSLYYRPQPRSSRADRRHDQRIIEVCGDKPAFGYRRVQWWLKDVGGLCVNRKRVLRVMRERGLLLRSRRFRVTRRKDWSTVEASHPNLVWQSDMTKLWARTYSGLGLSGFRAGLLYPRNRRLGLEFALSQPRRSHRFESGRAPGFAFRSS